MRKYPFKGLLDQACERETTIIKLGFKWEYLNKVYSLSLENKTYSIKLIELLSWKDEEFNHWVETLK